MVEQATDTGGAETRIFEAALEVFARKGRDGARMQQIADRAGINKAMLHYYFRSKERLYAEVFRHVFRRFGEAFLDAVELEAERSFDAALATFVDRYIDFVGSNLDVLRLMVNEFLAGGEVVRAEMCAQLATGSAPPQRLLILLARAIERGEIRPVEPRHLMLTLISACLFPFVAFPMVTTLFPEAEADREQFFAERKRHVLDLVRRGIDREET
jgi:TetR/AcrR family transcriptional regulator